MLTRAWVIGQLSDISGPFSNYSPVASILPTEQSRSASSGSAAARRSWDAPHLSPPDTNALIRTLPFASGRGGSCQHFAEVQPYPDLGIQIAGYVGEFNPPADHHWYPERVHPSAFHVVAAGVNHASYHFRSTPRDGVCVGWLFFPLPRKLERRRITYGKYHGKQEISRRGSPDVYIYLYRSRGQLRHTLHTLHGPKLDVGHSPTVIPLSRCDRVI